MRQRLQLRLRPRQPRFTRTHTLATANGPRHMRAPAGWAGVLLATPCPFPITCDRATPIRPHVRRPNVWWKHDVYRTPNTGPQKRGADWPRCVEQGAESTAAGPQDREGAWPDQTARNDDVSAENCRGRHPPREKPPGCLQLPAAAQEQDPDSAGVSCGVQDAGRDAGGGDHHTQGRGGVPARYRGEALVSSPSPWHSC